MRIDTLRQIETPEGIGLGILPAGPIPRGIAVFIDGLVRMVIYALAFFVIGSAGEMGAGLVSLLLFLGEWFYPVLFEVAADGKTPGKALMGLRVLHDDGTPVAWNASVIRNFLRILDFLPMAYGIGIACSLASQDFRRLGDWAAGTVVVYDRRRKRRGWRKTNDETPEPGPPARPVPVPLRRDEMRALLSLRRNHERWGEARSIELAELLEPITGKVGAPALEEALSWAVWLEEQD
ncbi:MAG: RDD family protein [Planctomycetota bacterium]